MVFRIGYERSYLNVSDNFRCLVCGPRPPAYSERFDSLFALKRQTTQLDGATTQAAKKLHPLSERLASLGIMGDKCRNPLKHLNTL